MSIHILAIDRNFVANHGDGMFPVHFHGKACENRCLATPERTLEGLNLKGFVKIRSQTEEPHALEIKSRAIEA